MYITILTFFVGLFFSSVFVVVETAEDWPCPTIVNGTSVVLTINTTVQMDSTCAVFGEMINLTVTCRDLSSEILCHSTSPCFEITGTMISFTLVGCVVRGAAVKYSVPVQGNVTIDGSVLDGLGIVTPVIVQGASTFVMTRTFVTRGVNLQPEGSGGCVALLGVRDSVFIHNVTVSQCSSIRGGGCVLILGCASVAFLPSSGDERCYTYGGHVSVTSSVFEMCSSRWSSGGVIKFETLRSLFFSNNIVQHGVSRTSDGCIDVYDIEGSGRISNVHVKNCTASTSHSGCIGISTIPDHPSPFIIDNVDLMDCNSSSHGGLRVADARRMVKITNVFIANGIARNGGCILVYSSSGVEIVNVLLRDCYAQNGAGLMMEYSYVYIKGLYIANAHSLIEGGAILARECYHVLVQNSVIYNASAPDGACIKLYQSDLTVQNSRLSCMNTTARPPVTKTFSVRDHTFLSNDSKIHTMTRTPTITNTGQIQKRSQKVRTVDIDVVVLNTHYTITSSSWIAPPDIIASTQIVQSVYASSCRGRSSSGSGRYSLKTHALSIAQFLSTDTSTGMDVMVTLVCVSVVHIVCCGSMMLVTLWKQQKTSHRGVSDMVRLMPYGYRYHLSFLIPMTSSLAYMSSSSSSSSGNVYVGVIGVCWVGFLTLALTPMILHRMLLVSSSGSVHVTKDHANAVMRVVRTVYHQTRTVSSLESVQHAGVSTIKALRHSLSLGMTKHGEWSPMSVSVLGGPLFTSYRGDVRGTHLW
eukprot:PhF_6_TR27939/c0_g1_i1/m.41170